MGSGKEEVRQGIMNNGGENGGTKKRDKDEEIYRLRVDGRYKSWSGVGEEGESKEKKYLQNGG